MPDKQGHAVIGKAYGVIYVLLAPFFSTVERVLHSGRKVDVEDLLPFAEFSPVIAHIGCRVPIVQDVLRYLLLRSAVSKGSSGRLAGFCWR